jgi:hypothetical protein
MNASHLDGESGEDRSKEGPAVPVGINVPKWYVYRPLKGKGGAHEAYDIRTRHRKARISNVLDRRQPTVIVGTDRTENRFFRRHRWGYGPPARNARGSHYSTQRTATACVRGCPRSIQHLVEIVASYRTDPPFDKEE